MSRRRVVALSATALMGAALLAGCSSSSGSSAPATSAAATSAAANMLPPVIIDEMATEATAKVGDNLDIIVNEKDLAGTTVSTDNKDLVELTQGGEKDGAVFNPGGKVLAPGTATITVTKPDNTTRTITLTITE